MNVPVFLFRIDELNSRSRGHQEIVGCFCDVTSMMKPVRVDIRSKLLLDFAGPRIATSEDAAVFA